MKKQPIYIIALLVCIIAFLVYKNYDYGNRLEGNLYIASFIAKMHEAELIKETEDNRNLLRRESYINVRHGVPIAELDDENISYSNSVCNVIKSGGDLRNELSVYKALIAKIYMETNIKLKVEDSAFNDVLANLSHFTNVPDSLWQMYAENRVRQIQNSISRNIMEHSKSGRFHFDRPMAVATSDNSIVRSGSYYESRIFLCNYDTAHNQDIKVYGERDFSTVKGLGHYETLAKTPGKHKLGGDIVVTAPDGEKKLYRFRTFYYAIAK